MAIDRIYNADCALVTQAMTNDNILCDMIMTSPPYNTSRAHKTEHMLETHQSRYDGYSDNLSTEDYVSWTVEMFKAFDKVLRNNAVICYNLSYGSERPDVMYQTIAGIISETPFTIADCIVWHKNNAMPNNTSRNKLTRICEFIFVIVRKADFATYNCNKEVISISRVNQAYYSNVFNYIKAPNNDGSCSLNKATYSSALCEQLISLYCPTDGLVYDPFMGTGTTAIGALKANRHFIGAEISKKQVIYANDRIDKYKKEGAITNV